MLKPNRITHQLRPVKPFEPTAPITYNYIDDIYVFYTPDGRLIQSKTYEEAEAKWLLTKETD